MKNLLSSVLLRLKHEPVAVWGVLIAAALSGAPLLGISSASVNIAVTVLTLLGIPVVRGKVTPAAALGALLEGAKAEGAASVAVTVPTVAPVAAPTLSSVPAPVVPPVGDAAP